MQSAQLAARTINDDPSIDLGVRVIDSRTISMGLGTIALACARAARDGAGIDDIEALAHDLVGRTRVYGALDTLENLKKGGRIGNAKALLATALSIKPIIEVTGLRKEYPVRREFPQASIITGDPGGEVARALETLGFCVTG